MDVSDLTSKSVFSVILVVIIVIGKEWVSNSPDEVRMYVLGQRRWWDVATESIEDYDTAPS